MSVHQEPNLKETSIPDLMLKLAPPVMLSLLVQSVYNVVDSYFVAQYNLNALTALAIIYPIQLFMIALATGTGTGVNLLITRLDGQQATDQQEVIAKSGLFLGGLNYLLIVGVGLVTVAPYYQLSTSNPLAQSLGIKYATIILIGSFSLFLEAIFTKLLQAKAQMKWPMIAQISGNLLNCLLNPLLIFGDWGFPKLGIAGSALATITGQLLAVLIVTVQSHFFYQFNGRFSPAACRAIYRQGSAAILLQSLYTVYIVGLNLILKPFGSLAITVLGIYYKLQAFFFIPLEGLQQVLLSTISFNFGAKQLWRIKESVRLALLIACSVTVLGTIVFIGFPRQLLHLYSANPKLLTIGTHAFKIIGSSFVPAGISMMLVIYFQATNQLQKSIWVSLTRELFLLVPIAWLLSFLGLAYFWGTFPITELLTTGLALILNAKKNHHLYIVDRRLRNR
ncbi:MATE family efflux transporter [Lentilactobacillus raoultii]|uniref:Probable multidrug resistance protein NorM n=1 Tax=Lentilactobacillus raoultii TaxID=1987503 RepID=A0ABW3PNJ9_9LACO|nr:MATE family efflux transporter [Lentilactobacillus raoultii]